MGCWRACEPLRLLFDQPEWVLWVGELPLTGVAEGMADPLGVLQDDGPRRLQHLIFFWVYEGFWAYRLCCIEVEGVLGWHKQVQIRLPSTSRAPICRANLPRILAVLTNFLGRKFDSGSSCHNYLPFELQLRPICSCFSL